MWISSKSYINFEKGLHSVGRMEILMTTLKLIGEIYKLNDGSFWIRNTL